jgi:hypothetical protein
MQCQQEQRQNQSEIRAAQILGEFEKKGFWVIYGDGNLDSETIEHLRRVGVRVKNENSSTCGCDGLGMCDYCSPPYKKDYAAFMDSCCP